MTARILRGITGALLATMAASPALAAGPTKLKQTAFPIVISKPGSYILTSNLVVPDADTTAIQVVADNVSIDLNGFSILGPTVCAPPPGNNPLSCTPSNGTGKGIDAASNGAVNLTVVNGTIRGMGSTGLAATQAQLRNLTVIGNGGDGINVFANSVITGCQVIGNAFGGIDANGGQRTVNGVIMGSASTVTGNTVNNNGTYGIYNDTGTVSGNTVGGNRTGIVASFGGTVIGNTVTNNSDMGLVGGCAGFIAGYKDNVFYNNNGGNAQPQVQPGCNLNLGNNACGAALCP